MLTSEECRLREGRRLQKVQTERIRFIENKGLTEMPSAKSADGRTDSMPRKSQNKELEVVESASIVDSLQVSHQMLGAAKYASYIHNQTKSDIVRFLTIVRDEKRYLDYSFDTFDEFLNSPLSPIGQRSFYNEQELFLKEGSEQYDLFNEWKIPARVRRQLTSGDISIDGDEVVVGSERVSITQGGSIKAILEQLVRDKIAAETKAAKAKDAADDYKDQLKKVVDSGNELLEENKRFRDQTPFERSMSQLLQSASNVAHCVRHQMSPAIRGHRADDDLHTIMVIFSDIAEAYGVAGWQKKLEEIHKRESTVTADEPPTKGKAATGGKTK